MSVRLFGILVVLVFAEGFDTESLRSTDRSIISDLFELRKISRIHMERSNVQFHFTNHQEKKHYSLRS